MPGSLEELYTGLVALDAELSRSRVLLDHLPLAIRPDTLSNYSRRLEQVEGVARLLGLPLADGTGRSHAERPL